MLKLTINIIEMQFSTEHKERTKGQAETQRASKVTIALNKRQHEKKQISQKKHWVKLGQSLVFIFSRTFLLQLNHEHK